eukprot:5438251-Prymnesium_polylepis.3
MLASPSLTRPLTLARVPCPCASGREAHLRPLTAPVTNPVGAQLTTVELISALQLGKCVAGTERAVIQALVGMRGGRMPSACRGGGKCGKSWQVWWV